MSEENFNFKEKTPNFYQSGQKGENKTSFMVGLLMKHFGVKNEKQARYLLIGLIILMFFLSAYWLISAF